jgi:hypothetical protein
MPESSARFLDALPHSARDAAHDWWSKLTDRDRAELQTLWDERQNSCAYAHATTETGAPEWRKLPIVVRGRFFDADTPTNDELEAWNVDLYEFLLDHPEVKIAETFTERTFHFCTAHEHAREVLKNGVLPADFICPFDAGDCPMRAILDLKPGQSLKLEGVTAR